MMLNNSVIQHFQGYEEFLKRLDDYLYQHEKYQKARLTPFLRPNEINVARRYLGSRVEYHFDGGYQEAEMQRLVIGEGDSEIYCLKANIADSQIKIQHKDVLGALMNLGMRRENFGDIFIKDDLAVIYTTRESYPYIIENLNQIHRKSVSFELCEPIENSYHIKEFTKSVSSYRLDAIVQTMCNISRNKAQELIRHKAVSLNYEVLEETAHLCNNEDTISVRGYGKFRIYETISMTRKNRYLIRFGKYE